MAIRLFHSLKEKVLAGYLIGFFLMLGVILLNLKNFTEMQSMVLKGEKVSELIDTILEVRRYEKNYFLYGKKEDIEELSLYLGRLKKILTENRHDIELFTQKGFLLKLEKDIKEYEELLGHLKQPKNNLIYWEERIRNKGKDIVKAAENLIEVKREKIKDAMVHSKRIFILSIIFLIISGFIASVVFYRNFARPLALFERYMKKIAEGEYAFIPTPSQDREIVSLSNAFNRMLAELKLRQSQLIQKEKLASLGTLLFGVVHELNNPLNNISTSCQILREEIETADLEFKKELLVQIEEEVDRARDIVRSVLDYSKAGDKKEINLYSTINEAVRLIRSEIPSKIELLLDIPENIAIFADPQQIKQVFLNLIKNSVEAIEGEGQIKITAKVQEPYVEMKISDTGKGMSQEVLSRIFDPFFTTKEGRSGYGLGLFVTYNIIKEHGGTIDVQSSPGHGTTFTIRIPRKGEKI